MRHFRRKVFNLLINEQDEIALQFERFDFLPIIIYRSQQFCVLITTANINKYNHVKAKTRRGCIAVDCLLLLVARNYDS